MACIDDPTPGHRLSTLWLPATALSMGHHGALLRWLQHPDSLTARLRAHCHGQFSVEVLDQYWGMARLDETQALNIPQRSRVLVREVLLKGYGQPWVWARSILPERSLTGTLRHLRKLSEQPLGGWLFRQQTLERGPVKIRAFLPGDPVLPSQLGIHQPLWGRRSVFRVHHKPLLVAEVFLPDFVKTLESDAPSSVVFSQTKLTRPE